MLYDRTTELPALPVLFEPLRSALDMRRHLGVLHLELANLELVESLYGWQVFDRIVARVSAVLRSALGNELPDDTLLGLNGVAGDRFVVFVIQRPGGGEPDAAYLAALAEALGGRLEAALQEDEFRGLSPGLVVRAGHALLSHDPFYRFERRVYMALDEAAHYNARRERRRELSWGEELQTIIRDATVHTVFQPVVDLRNRSIIGHEAFVRGPRDSLFEMPRTMFAISSRVGAEGELDRVCRESALRSSAGMAGRGKLFLNVLPQSLAGADNGHGMRALAEAAAMDPGELVLEFSERHGDRDLDGFLEILERYKQFGFAIALDDVGTGFNSRPIVEQARPDFLKLDLSLVHGIDRNLLKQDLLGALIQLGSEAGAAVVAEGIEREEEAVTVLDAGARYGQGYLFASPAPAGAGRDEGH